MSAVLVDNPATSSSSSSIVNQAAGENFVLTEVPDDRTKIDLDYTPRPNRASLLARTRVTVAMREPTLLLETYLMNEMLVGGATAMVLFRAWLANGTVTERNFPELDAATSTTPAFKIAAGRFEAKLDTNLREQWQLGKVDYHDLVTGAGPTHTFKDVIAKQEAGKATGRLLTALEPPDISLSIVDDTPVKICIGSFQGVKVLLSDFQVNFAAQKYTGNLTYELRDHFGVDDDDCEVTTQGLHGTPGQVAMWVLQHHRRTGHVPWITLVKVKRAIGGRLV